MALEAVVLFIFTAIFFSLVPLIRKIGMGKIFFTVATLILVYIALGSPLVYGIAWLEEEGKRELMLIVALVFITLFPALVYFIAVSLLYDD
jgi:uncharacterized membrane protein